MLRRYGVSCFVIGGKKRRMYLIWPTLKIEGRIAKCEAPFIALPIPNMSIFSQEIASDEESHGVCKTLESVVHATRFLLQVQVKTAL